MPDIDALLRHRGGAVLDRDGQPLGTLAEVYLDDRTDAPSWALVTTSDAGGRFAPLDGAREEEAGLRLDRSAEQVRSAPEIADHGHVSVQEEEQLARHYGLGGGAADGAMTRSEEELQVAKTTRAAGRARLRKHVVTEQVTITVPVRREVVRVEREPVGEAGEPAGEAGEAAAGSLTGGQAEGSDAEGGLVLHEEEIVIDKRVVPRERVRLTKEVVTDEQVVEGDVRRERIDVEQPDRPSTD